MIFTEPVLLSIIGGLCSQLLALAELPKVPKNERPDFKDIAYWVPYLVNPFFGGVLGYGYFHDNPAHSSLLAIHIGVSAPLIIRSMFVLLPKGLHLKK